MLRIVLLAAALAAALPAAAETARLSPAQRAAVMAGVKRDLIDPPSARFGPMRAFPENGALTVCGTVNAKNSFGGYTGPRPFLGRLAGRHYTRLDPRDRWPAPCHGVDD